MSDKFIRAEDVAKELDISKAYAYKLIQKMNAELREKGYMTIAGRINRQYFAERFYGIKSAENGTLPLCAPVSLEADGDGRQAGHAKDGGMIMSAKNCDALGRFRSVTVGFRVSPEEGAQLDRLVELSGLTKQDYITDRLMERDVVVQGNPKVYKALKGQLTDVLNELKRIEAGASVDSELMELIRFITNIMNGMKEESK